MGRWFGFSVGTTKGASLEAAFSDNETFRRRSGFDTGNLRNGGPLRMGLR
jgi:hypothetical protein